MAGSDQETSLTGAFDFGKDCEGFSDTSMTNAIHQQPQVGL
jgi:hypothetical protein